MSFPPPPKGSLPLLSSQYTDLAFFFLLRPFFPPEQRLAVQRRLPSSSRAGLDPNFSTRVDFILNRNVWCSDYFLFSSPVRPPPFGSFPRARTGAGLFFTVKLRTPPPPPRDSEFNRTIPTPSFSGRPFRSFLPKKLFFHPTFQTPPPLHQVPVQRNVFDLFSIFPLFFSEISFPKLILPSLSTCCALTSFARFVFIFPVIPLLRLDKSFFCRIDLNFSSFVVCLYSQFRRTFLPFFSL